MGGYCAHYGYAQKPGSRSAPNMGDKVTLMGEGPVIFNEQNAYRYGLFLGKGMRNTQIFLDPRRRQTSCKGSVGVRSGLPWQKEFGWYKSKSNFHLSYPADQYTLNLYSQWLASVNTMQSGHGSGHDVPVWEWITRDWNLVPTKPTLDAEPNYEDHPVNPWPKWDSANGYFNDYDVRKQTYRSVFAGACGVTYGHHSVWQFWSLREEKVNHADCYWTDAINRPGAYQVGFLRKLIESRPPLSRIPDQQMILEGQGVKGEYMTSMRSSDGTYAMIYLPYGKKIAIRTNFAKSSKLKAWWFNPRDSKAIPIGLLEKRDSLSFTPPSLGYMNDWVLVVDDPTLGYKLPGTL